MKAVIFSKYGTPADLKFTEVARPTPQDHEVLVEVHAASVNSWDWELLHGTPFANRLGFGLFRPTKINSLGCDIAGRVVAVGKDVTRFKPSDEVYGDLSADGWGGYAEYLRADAQLLMHKPAGMTFEQAAAIPQAALLAWQGLHKGGLRSGQQVLINGAGGGVGSFAMQIAKAQSAEVTGVDSTAKLELVRRLGADHVVDYTREDFTRDGQQYDLILDAQAHHSISDYRRSLKPGGSYVIVGGSMTLILTIMLLGPLLSRFDDKKKMMVLLHKANDGLDVIEALFATGKVVPVIDRIYPLHEVAQALADFGAGKVKGKYVIRVKDA
ncbi:MAG: NAD(P)-dependent alcohol dehydrogenase [Gammaproteobacteria bacterium]|nr:NAD(P)-dependent alcohol dehydrogenase [Gammaproteobacteria bacterium]